MNEIESTAKETVQTATSVAEAYQAKLLEITNENLQFTMEFGQALTGIRSPTEFINITSEYTKRRLELFQKHTEELMSLAHKVTH